MLGSVGGRVLVEASGKWGFGQRTGACQQSRDVSGDPHPVKSVLLHLCASGHLQRQSSLSRKWVCREESSLATETAALACTGAPYQNRFRGLLQLALPKTCGALGQRPQASANPVCTPDTRCQMPSRRRVENTCGAGGVCIPQGQRNARWLCLFCKPVTRQDDRPRRCVRTQRRSVQQDASSEARTGGNGSCARWGEHGQQC